MKYTAISAFGTEFDWTPFHWLEGNMFSVPMTQTKNILEDVTMEVFLLWGPLETYRLEVAC